MSLYTDPGMPHGIELNRAIAIEVMGWKWLTEETPGSGHWALKDGSPTRYHCGRPFAPSSEIEHAWLVVVRMQRHENSAASNNWCRYCCGILPLPNGFLNALPEVMWEHPELMPLAISQRALHCVRLGAVKP